MGFISRVFLKGLAAILPLALTVFLISWLGGKAESLLGGWLREVTPKGSYVPGMGIIAGILLVFGVGLLTHLWLIKQVLKGLEKLVLGLPVVRSIYSALSDFVKYLTQPKSQGMDQVVAVMLPGLNAKIIGFVTRNDLQGLPDELGDKQNVAVYLPMSFQVAGYTLYLSRDQITPLDLTLEDGMRLALTAGMNQKSESVS